MTNVSARGVRGLDGAFSQANSMRCMRRCVAFVLCASNVTEGSGSVMYREYQKHG